MPPMPPSKHVSRNDFKAHLASRVREPGRRARAVATPHASTIRFNFWGKGPRSRPHSRLTHTLGLIGQRPHLVLKEFGLQLEGVLHVLGLGQLVAEVECRADIALHKITNLLGLSGDRQRRALACRRRSSASVSIARTFSGEEFKSAIVLFLSY